MFEAKTPKIERIYKHNPKSVDNLNKLFGVSVGVYIDYANIRPWSDRIGFHIDIKRLWQFLDSFMFINTVNFYQGILERDEQSENDAKLVTGLGYNFVTKPVKIMKHSIDVSSIPKNSPILVDQFLRRNLLRKLSIDNIDYLNQIFSKLNKEGIYYIEDRKCNFDVEMGIDMLIEFKDDNFDTYVVFSGDSDFCDPIKRLLNEGCKVILFASSRCVARELQGLKQNGLIIFDIKKIKEYICWNREIPEELYSFISQKEPQ